MINWFRPRIRHPFFPGLTPAPARDARGCAPALYGGFSDLLQAAARGASASRAVFVLLGFNARILTQAERDCLWELFETPVYAIRTGEDGRVCAFECEAQDGFHIPAEPGADREIMCECGRPGPVLHASEHVSSAF